MMNHPVLMLIAAAAVITIVLVLLYKHRHPEGYAEHAADIEKAAAGVKDAVDTLKPK